jgi:U5 small nuclear ribonucleoprotein component
VDEIERKISLKAAPFQILLKDSKDKSFVYNVMDTPGHPDFIDEVLVSLRFADNVILVVDVFEGCTMQTEKII